MNGCLASEDESDLVAKSFGELVKYSPNIKKLSIAGVKGNRNNGERLGFFLWTFPLLRS
jgi:hypothetical protein